MHADVPGEGFRHPRPRLLLPPDACLGPQGSLAMTAACPAQPLALPVKTREIHNHHMDSTAWNGFRFREDDVVIATYGKAGTTWTQQIVSQLIFRGAENVNVAKHSPWLDLRVPDKKTKHALLDAQTHRRVIKTHLPVDALVFSPKAKYVYIARDGRDVVWSLYNHHRSANAEFFKAINDTPGRVGPPLPIAPPPSQIRQYFLDWLEGDGYPFWPFWENVRTWWEIRDLPNVMLLHFNDLKRDLPGQVARIAEFLSVDLDDAEFARACEHCTFDHMKRNAALVAPLGGAVFDGGADTFIHKGTNGRWHETLTGDDCARYEAKAREELGDACSRWLATGVR